MLVRFGGMRDLIQPRARYLVKVSTDRGEEWRAVPLAEYKEIHPKGSTSTGAVEMFAQRCEVQWISPSGNFEYRAYYVPPVVLERGNSSCTFSAVDRSVGFFSADVISRFAEEVGAWVIINDTPDNCRVNLRMQAFLAGLLGPRVLFSPGGCVAHKVHRIVHHATREKDVVGNCHALQFVFSIQGRRQQIWNTL